MEKIVRCIHGHRIVINTRRQTVRDLLDCYICDYIRKIQRLTTALEKYGGHVDGCKFGLRTNTQGDWPFYTDCTCGLGQALEGGE